MGSCKRKLRDVIPGVMSQTDSDAGFQKGYRFLPVSVWTTDTAKPPTAGVYGTTARSQLAYMSFTDTEANYLYATWVVPRDYYNGLKLKVHWNANSTKATTAVIFSAEVRVVTLAALVDGTGTTASAVALAPTGTAYQLRTSEIDLDISGVSYTVGDVVMICLYRNTGATGDDMTTGALMLGGELRWNRSA